MLLSICLIFCQFEPGVAYKSVAYNKACKADDEKPIVRALNECFVNIEPKLALVIPETKTAFKTELTKSEACIN